MLLFLNKEKIVKKYLYGILFSIVFFAGASFAQAGDPLTSGGTNFTIQSAPRNIYLDNNITRAGDGSIENPYGAFSEINWSSGGANSIKDWVTAGEDVVVNLKKGSLWREQLQIRASGTASHPITIQAYGTGADPIINGGADLPTPPTYHPVLIKGYSYITLDGLEVTKGVKSNIVISAWGTQTSNITVQNCTSSYSEGVAGIDLYGDPSVELNKVSDCLIIGNYAHNNKQHGIGMFRNAENIIVSRNITHHNGWGGTNASTGGHGITAWAADGDFAPNNLIWEYNISYDNYVETSLGLEGNGLQFDGNTYNSVMRYNISYNNEGSGFVDNGAKTSVNTLHNNIAFNNVIDGIVATPDRSSIIYNNTLHGNTNNITVSNNNVVVKKNICSEATETEINVTTNAYPYTGVDIDYNLIYHPDGGTPNFMIWGGVAKNWADWVTASGATNSTNDNPDFTDKTIGDFTLLPASPAIGAGL
jgi:parallel beta-helix repeat protein